MAGFDESRPIFLQLAEMLEDGIISGRLSGGGADTLHHGILRGAEDKSRDGAEGHKPAR